MDNGYPYLHCQPELQDNNGNAKVGTSDRNQWKRRCNIQCLKKALCKHCRLENIENCRYSTSVSPSSTTDSIEPSSEVTSKSNTNFRSDLLRHEILECQQLGLPLNPHTWTGANVLTWLRGLSKLHRLACIDYGKFAMNGKGLCFMSLAAFKSRCPRAGKLLHTDLQRKMIAHIYLLVLQNYNQSRKPARADAPSPTTE